MALPNAQAAEFPAEAGFVTLSGGLRFLPHTSVAARAKGEEQSLEHFLLQGGGILGLGYRIDHDWAVVVEFSGGADRVFLENQRYDFLTFGLQATGNYSLPIGPKWLDPYLGAGIGYWLSTVNVKETKSSSEDTVLGGMAGAGVRFALSDHIGVVSDFRWIWARQQVPFLGATTTGGGLLSIGLVYTFAPSPEDRF